MDHRSSSIQPRCRRFLSLVATGIATGLCLDAQADSYYRFDLHSEPPGIIETGGAYPVSSFLGTPSAPLSASGYCFAYWTINGTRIADPLGQALTQVNFVLLGDTTAVATYLLPSADSDGDTLPDYWEWRYYLTQANSASSDADGDGFAHNPEMLRGYNPAVYDDLRDGGFAMRLSENAVVRDEAAMKRYEIRSEPQSILPLQTGYSPAGAVLVTPVMPYGAINGHYFGYWEVNGVRQAARSGMALPQATLTMTNDMTAVARFYAAGDVDGDGLQDWHEQYWFGHLFHALDSDPDNDGLSISDEIERGYEVVVFDDLRDGGAMMRVSENAIVRNEASMKRFEIRSEPKGVVPFQTGYAPADTVVMTPALPYGATSGFYFGYWEVNGVRQAAGSGMALPQAALAMNEDRVAIARFFPAGDDDGDRLEDWLEQYWFGDLTQDLESDPDGDGLSISQELERGYEAIVHDDLRDGGMLMRLSGNAFVRNEAAMKQYTIRSEPQGIVQTGYAPVGTVILTPALNYGATNGHYFGYWEVNGIRQAARSGMALPQATLTMNEDREAIARFFPSGDSDDDALEDGLEQYWFGDLSQDLLSDPDGDGLGIADELVRGYDPLGYDDLRDGGIVMRFSCESRLALEYMPRVANLLVGGAMTTAFVESGGSTGALSVAQNSAPALGDWDGDLDTDLIIGGAGGELRFLRNEGSPNVANFVEVSESCAWMSSVWNGVGNVAPCLGDWTGDGQDDLAIGGDTDRIRFVASCAGWQEISSERQTAELAVVGAHRTLPAFGDYNEDAWPDLFVLRDDGTIEVLIHSGGFTEPYAYPAAATNLLGLAVPDATGLAIEDMNEDGRPDVLLSDSTGRIWEFRQEVSRNFVLRSRGYGGTYPGFAERMTVSAGDMDGDGDMDVVAGFAQGGLIFLRNLTTRLSIAPPSATLLSGSSMALTVPGASTGLTWRYVHRASGGSLDEATGAYVAGPTNGVLDVIEALDGNSGFSGRSYVNVIGEADMTRAGKAVIIAGRKSVADPLWTTTDYLADTCYNTLVYRGYAKGNIHYLSPEPEQDADGNGVNDDTAGYATLENVAFAVTNWSARSDRLLVYLVDHGGDSDGAGLFRLNPTETLTAAQLDVWLDALQDRYTNDVVVVVDCCESGSFLDELTYPGPARRTVLTACSANEPTYFVAGGLVSFSDAFFAGILMGLDVGDAFSYARDAMKGYQSALLDADGTGTYQTGLDESVADGILIGASFVTGKDIPQIGSVSDAQILTGSTKAAVWAADVASAYPVDRVWCLIVPPGHQSDPEDPVGDLPVLPLAYNPETRRYEAEYSGFSQSGPHKVLCYARDIWGSVSLPRQTYVTQDGYVERVVFGSDRLGRSDQCLA